MSTDMATSFSPAIAGPRDWYWRMEHRITRESVYVGPYETQEDAKVAHLNRCDRAPALPRGAYVLASYASFPRGYNPSHSVPAP
jgi:hypothetical protein